MSRIYFNLGNCAREKSQWADAITAYQHSIDFTEGQFFPARYNLIISIDAAGDTPAALEKAKQLCLDMPKHAQSWHIYGIMLARLRQYTKAIEAFQKALSRDPTHLESRDLMHKAQALLEANAP